MKNKVESNTNEFISVNHKIQKHIIDLLTYQKTARFSELRPPRTDTNLFTYHLKRLVKLGLVDTVEEGYTLGARGLAYVQPQQKIITLFVVQNGDGDILLQKQTKQPFIDTWALPNGKILPEDASVKKAAQREVTEKLHLQNQEIEHAGDCYIRVHSKGMPLSIVLAHVFRFYNDNIKTNDEIIWARPHKLRDLALAPAVEEIMARTFFKDPFYFEEYDVDWYTEKHES